VEVLRDAFVRASTPEQQKKIAVDIRTTAGSQNRHQIR
jgi:hypothetical protein